LKLAAIIEICHGHAPTSNEHGAVIFFVTISYELFMELIHFAKSREESIIHALTPLLLNASAPDPVTSEDILGTEVNFHHFNDAINCLDGQPAA
jgi:hypothetical protein